MRDRASARGLRACPEAVHAALAQSERLNSLKSRIWRPLDQPLIPRATTDVDTFDVAIETSEDHFGGER